MTTTFKQPPVCFKGNPALGSSGHSHIQQWHSFIRVPMQTSGGGGDGWGRWLAAVFPLSADMKGSVWEPRGQAHTSRRCCGPDSHPLITSRTASQQASLSWDTPWTLHRTDGDLLNMQQNWLSLPLTAAAHMDNVSPLVFFFFFFSLGGQRPG